MLCALFIFLLLVNYGYSFAFHSLSPVRIYHQKYLGQINRHKEHEIIAKGIVSPPGAVVDTLAVGAELDFHKYAFMLPTATAVATMAISSGIGGAALFGPILLIVFPALGPQYPLASPAAAVAVAILVECFGFSSGLLGYYRRGLVDAAIALRFAAISVPAAVWAASSLVSVMSPLTLKLCYSMLMLGLSTYLLFSNSDSYSNSSSSGIGNDSGSNDIESRVGATKIDRDGNKYYYDADAVVTPVGAAFTAVGAVLTGLLGVGIGEVVLPQLLRKQLPVAVAAATSTFTVTLTALAAAAVQLAVLLQQTGRGIAEVVPLELVVYMIPGVVVGGQLAAALQGRFTQQQLEKAIGLLFGCIGLLFSLLTYRQSLVV